MKIGCPKEIKPQEFRVGMTPNAAREAVAHGHDVVIETGAGLGAGFDDASYIAAGAKILATAGEIFASADMIVKVKEPQKVEVDMIRENQIVAERLDKKTTIINLDVKDVNEQWAYLFSKALVKNAIDLYLEIKIGKLLRAEEELTNKRDSIRSLLDGSITTLAYETDLNSHTPLMRYKTNQVKKQIDVEVLKSMYANVIQNLEVTKIQRAQEEPIIEIIDEPILPLSKEKMGTVKGMMLSLFLFEFLFITILVIRWVITNLVLV